MYMCMPPKRLTVESAYANAEVEVVRVVSFLAFLVTVWNCAICVVVLYCRCY